MRVRSSWAIILLVVGALEFAVSYQGAVAVAVFVPAAVLPFGLVALGQRARLGTFVPTLVTIVLAALGAWIALRRATSDSLGGLGDAVPRLLTTARPAPTTAALLAPPALLIALVAAVVAACVLAPASSRSDGRFGGLLAPVVGAVALYVPAQLLAAGHADPHGIVAVCLLVVIVGGWSLPYLRGGTTASWRPAAAVPIVAVAVLALGAAALTSAQAFDPRRHVTPPTIKLDEPSPLSQLGSWAANPGAVILQTNVSGTGRLHLATLDRYTGASWQVDAGYQQLGLVDTPDLPAGGQRTTAKATVRIVRLAGVWLPGPGVATSSSLSDVLMNPDDGTLARPQHARPGLTYDVRAQVNAPSAKQLQVAPVPQAVPKRYLDLPDVPVAFRTYATAAVRGASTPLEEAVAIENAVSTNRKLDPKAPTGSSYGRLSTFLFAKPGTAGAGVGTDEQFAASFAVLARAVGLPTRLTVGFLLGKPAANGTVTVRGGDATVWPEVYFTGIGWVPFAPVPGDAASSADGQLRDTVLQRLSEQVKRLPVVAPPKVTPPTNGQPPPTQTAQGAPASQRAAQQSMPGWLLALIIAAGVVVLIGAGLAGLRARRRRRHRRSGARGAWAEVLDVLVLTGRRPSLDRPAPETAADLDTSLGTAAGEIAQAADREAFAPDSPTSQADMWGSVRVVQRRARSTLPRYRRVLFPVDPRPLIRK